MIADLIQESRHLLWMVSYDNVPEITGLYRHRRRAVYNLDYTASTRSVGTEVMFFCDQMKIPPFQGMRLWTPPAFTTKKDLGVGRSSKRDLLWEQNETGLERELSEDV